MGQLRNQFSKIFKKKQLRLGLACNQNENKENKTGLQPVSRLVEQKVGFFRKVQKNYAKIFFQKE